MSRDAKSAGRRAAGGGAAPPASRPRAVMLSKRANVFYLEHCRVMLVDDRIVYLMEDAARPDLPQPYYNVPERNTAFVLLGKGTSITDAAARRLAESNVMVGFCGSGGSPLFGALDLTFLAPQSEYRPTEHMQRWMRCWLDEPTRMAMARELLRERVRITAARWAADEGLVRAGLKLPEALAEEFVAQIERACDTQALMVAEAHWARSLYALLARGFKFEFIRREGERAFETRADVTNSLLDHGNYIAYGYAAVVLCGLGISFALPLLHGKTRRGALVFDVADLIKDGYVMPLAFTSATGGDRRRDFRASLIERCQDDDVLDKLFTFVSGLAEKFEC